ncbi:MAG: hypothetical protein IJ435_04890 [Clostridia bacterium]|nr:hypothetical protein [Clostridia bacterium]
MFGANEKYIVRLMLKNRIHESEGQAYENLFTIIMQKSNPNFEQVKPYGNIGDWKNDGFDKTSGTYYQVYAPEDITKANTVDNAIKKLENDFKGIYDHWNSICPIRKYYYVINDKYRNLPPQIHNAILNLGKKYPEIEFNLFKAKDLEDCFMSLNDDEMVSVVGCVATPHIQLDYSALTDVISHLMELRGDYMDYERLFVPDFEEKIRFNNLSQRISALLIGATYQVASLENYFKNNSEYAKADIQQRISHAYIDAVNSVEKAEENYGDQVFIKLIDKIYPNGTPGIKNAVLVLMAYFFETCDIFEKPEEEMGNDDPS